MKLPLLLLVSLLLLLSSSAPLLSTAQFPLDINGDPLKKGTKYYILRAPIIPGSGGVALGKLDPSESCPSYVALRPFSSVIYQPVVFKNLNPLVPEGYVGLNERNRVMFADTLPCAGSPAWWETSTQSNGRVYLSIVSVPPLNDRVSLFEVRSTDQPGQYQLVISRCLLHHLNNCDDSEVGLYDHRILGVGVGTTSLNVAFSKAENFDYIRQYPSKLKY